MRVPIQSPPVSRVFTAARRPRTGVAPADCGVIQGIECASEAGGIVAGPCDPLGWPEDLPACFAALVPFVGTCKDCLGPVGDMICEAVNAAAHAGIPVPAPIKAVCS